jgi:DNA-binding CsgD family transcriptional regulator
VAVGEEFFRECWSAALYVTMLLAVIAVILALLNGKTTPTGTLVIAAAICLGARAAQRPSGYEWLRRHRYATGLAGPVAALSSLWPAVDANALYFPALAPLALIACVAQRRRERIVVIASLALGTLVAAILDTRSPELSTSAELASATAGAAITGLMVGIVVDWCARKVLLAPDDLDADLLRGNVVELRSAKTVDEDQQLERVSAISRASRDDLKRNQSKSLSGLTARELQIVFLTAEGLDRHDIADRLSISPKTVDKHVEHVRDKTGLRGSGRPTSWLTDQLPPFTLHRPDPPT